MRRGIFLLAALLSAAAVAGAETADGREPARAAAPSGLWAQEPTRVALGYMDADEFVAFLRSGEPEASPAPAPEERGFWAVLGLVLAALAGGLAMNLTPCVLPMVPVNLMIIGKSWKRGAAYGLGIALAYGTLGVLAAVGGLAFGVIQSSPWFNLAVALVFAGLGLSLLDVFVLDFSRFRSGATRDPRASGRVIFPFAMGALSAVLAGACVAPVLVSVLLLTAKAYAEGKAAYLAMPFVLGLGMALPWPLLGAGLKVLPKPGAWMKWTNRCFAAVLFCLSAHYAHLTLQGWGVARSEASAGGGRTLTATPQTLESVFATLTEKDRPVLLDCWGTWCRVCTMMDRGPLKDPKVVEALGDWTVIRVQAEESEDLDLLYRKYGIQGLPAFVMFR